MSNLEKNAQQHRFREKHLNISDFGLIEEGVVKRTRDKIIRFAIVLTTIVAWFSISNHCALGGLIVAA
ncbi:MAG TPA: hypothetical protein DCK99_18435 [Blastocatellia bacterium]|nr:hypothetical protein [Blastocatellia bacterium]